MAPERRISRRNARHFKSKKNKGIILKKWSKHTKMGIKLNNYELFWKHSYLAIFFPTNSVLVNNFAIFAQQNQSKKYRKIF